jgi:hypothetical protein
MDGTQTESLLDAVGWSPHSALLRAEDVCGDVNDRLSSDFNSKEEDRLVSCAGNSPTKSSE